MRPPNDWHIHVTLPGILRETIRTRFREFHYTTFSPFATELICFDLRARRDHDVTQPFADDEPKVQDAVDRTIIRGYHPNKPRSWGLIEKILRGEPWITEPIDELRGEFAAFRAHVYFPIKLKPLVQVRWPELGYESLSAYLTGLIRYDLLLGGPHKYFNGADTDPELLAALDEETIRDFHARKRQKILLEYLLERTVGRALTPEESKAEMKKLAGRLRENAMRSRLAGVSHK